MRTTAKSVGAAILTLLFAIAAIATILGYFHIEPKDLRGMITSGSWLSILSAALFSVAAIAAAAYSLYLSLGVRRKLEAEIQKLRAAPEAAPLAIISARWGIGGNAYKNVTGIVREHAKADSINLPVSRGLFGDPYPNAKKKLIVDYSFARQWWVEIEEDGILSLPEKEGQEHSRLEMEKAKQRLAAITKGPWDPNRSYLEAQAFTQLSDEFFRLSWVKKVAIKLLIFHGIADEITLRGFMATLGIGTDAYILNDVIPGLRSCNLLEYKPSDGTLRPNPARLRDVEEIVAEWNFEFMPPTGRQD